MLRGELSPAYYGECPTRSGFASLEVAAGMPLGLCRLEPTPTAALPPRAALAKLLRTSLAHSPCLIAFSGGRDSSALLAVAVDLARGEGWSLPVPVTLRFQSAATDESAWQELVLRELGIDDWVRLPIGDELDLVGPVAARGLRRHGLMYPANAHLIVPMARAATGGSLLTGVGGDDIFGNWSWHGIASLLAGRRPVRPPDLRSLVHMLAPRWLQAEVIRRREPLLLPWIRASERGRVARALAGELASAPRTWSARMLWSTRWRAWRLTAQSMRMLAQDQGASLGSPFLHPSFLTSLAAAGGRWGWGDRGATMRAVFGDKLPESVIARRGKAEFSGPLFGPHTKRFAAVWDGRAGEASHLLDNEALRNAWRSERPNFLSAMALQAAWIATNDSASLEGSAREPAMEIQ